MLREMILSWWLGVGVVPVIAQSDPDGYQTTEVKIAQPGAFVGGFTVLPNGNYAVYDGDAVIERSRDGRWVAPLFDPVAFVYGAFLKVDPGGTTLYFGESSFGDIWAIDLATKSANVVANLNFPFDLAFDPCGRAFIAWSAGFGMDSFVSYVDLATGSHVPAIRSTEATGGLDFEPGGSLLYIRPDTSSYPPPPDSSALYRFSKAEIDDALINGPILDQSGAELARFQTGFDVVRDPSGDLFISNALDDTIYEVDAETGLLSIFYDHLVNFWAFTHLAFVNGSKGAFEPYQPEEGGTLLAVHSDFNDFNELVQLQPRRPTTTVDTGVPIPVGPFTLELEGFVPDGQAIVLLGADVTEEIGLPNASWPAPLYFGLTGSGLLLFAIGTDSDGEASLAAVNPGTGGAVLGVQVVAAGGAGAPLYGTSAPLRLELD